MTTVVPLTLIAVLSAVFSAGLPTDLPIGVLDMDRSTLSRAVIRAAAATSEAAVVVAVDDLGEGRRLIQSGRIHGLLMLPNDLERDVLGGRRPDVVFFYNVQRLSAGNIAFRGVRAAVRTQAAGVCLALRAANGQPVDRAKRRADPIPVQVNALFNPTLNYIPFLLATIVPAVLQVVIATTSAYAVALDLQTRRRLPVFRRLGGGLAPAIAGKLLPYTLIFMAVLAVADLILFAVLGAPMRGYPVLLIGAGLLFVLACQSIGALLALLIGDAARAVSITTLLTAPAFGFMGVGFPRIAMNDFAYVWGAGLPGTWYLQARVDQTVRGAPLDLSGPPFFALAAILAALLILIALRVETLRARRRAADDARLGATS